MNSNGQRRASRRTRGSAATQTSNSPLARELAQLRAELAKQTPSVEEELRRVRARVGGVAEHLAREAAFSYNPLFL